MPHRRRRSGATLSAGLRAAAVLLLLAAPALRAQAAPPPPDQPPPPAPADSPGDPASPDQPPSQGTEPAGKPAATEVPADQAPSPPPEQAPPPDQAPPDQPPPDQPPPEAAPPATSGAEGAGATSSTYFNPSISVIGNFLAVAGDENPIEDLPSASLRESELGLQAVVDPYGRADFFLSFGEEGVDVEEGFITFTALPAQLLVKVGRMRPYFGKINTLHLHVLPWPDEPLPVVDFLGTDEGWIGTGASVARLIPLPADTFSELTLQVFRGEAEGLFQEEKRSDLAWNGHYRVFRDLTDSTNLDLGVSYALGPNETGPGEKTRLGAFDATFRWKPLERGRYRSFTARGELFQGEREQPGPDPGSALGWLVSGEVQLAQRWFAGARIESAEHLDDPAARDRGAAILLTFWPSEFSQLRGELRRREYAAGLTADEFLMQLQFAIGAHGAHPF